jgi:surface antigen
MAAARLLRCRLPALAALLLIGVAASACSYRLGGSLAKEDPDQTGTVTPARAANNLPPEADLAIAKAAVHDVLTRGGEGASTPWENPRSGARGTVTPIASAYNQDGFVCHDFLASYVREGSESWMQGEACRIHRGKWEVKSLRPLKKT